MAAEAVLISVIVVLHLLGISVFLVNGLYLNCTRGYDRALNVFNAPNEELENLKSMRCCKIRSIKAANMLAMYYAMLVIFDFVFIFVYQSLPASSKVLSSNETRLWIMPMMSYIFIYYFILLMGRFGVSTRAHIGPISVVNILEFLHFVIFWASFLFMITCAAVGCSHLSEDLRNYAAGYGAIPMTWCYIWMLVGTCMHMSFLKLEVISKRAAVNLINEKIQETPSTAWTISCGHWTQGRHSSHFYEMHRETKIYNYDSNNIRRTVKPDVVPAEDMFQRRVTKLVVLAEIRPGDLWTLNNMERTTELFRLKHKGHDEKLRLTVSNSSEEIFLVRRDESDSTAEALMNGTRYWIFALLGLSLPYRWYLYCSLGHIKFIIRRKVFSQSGPTDASFTDEHASPLPASSGSNTQHSAGYGVESANYEPKTSEELPSPPDYESCITIYEEPGQEIIISIMETT